MVKAVCAERRCGNGADSGWLCLLARRSRTKDDDEDDDDPGRDECQSGPSPVRPGVEEAKRGRFAYRSPIVVLDYFGVWIGQTA